MENGEAQKKKRGLSEVTKQRIWLYGGIFVVLLACSVFVKYYNRAIIEKNGMALTSDAFVPALCQVDQIYDLDAMAKEFTREVVFDSDTVVKALKRGDRVLVDSSKDAASPAYLLIVGSDENGWIACDGNGNTAPVDKRYYRCYIE